MKNPLIKRFGTEKRWVNFRIETVKGKTTKVPYSITGRKASSTDPKSWATFAEAYKKDKHVGIVFTPECNLLGIDIDHCLKGKRITHEKAEEIAALLIEAETYTEVSPSGEGLHLYFELNEPLKLVSNKRAPFEAYTSGRYFTFTGNNYGKIVYPVRKISAEEALKILAIIGYPWKDDTSNSDRGEVVLENKLGGSVLSDEEVIRKMCVSHKKLYEGDISNYEKDASKADMALLSHLAFWTRKDAEQMQRIWLASPLGKRKKTQERPDYVTRSIAAAIGFCKAVYETPKMKMDAIAPDLNLLFRRLAKGEIEYIQNTENMCRILRSHPDFAGRFRFDSFKNTYEIEVSSTTPQDALGDKWRTLEDADAIIVQTAISVLFSDWFGKVGKDMIYDAIIKVSKEQAIDSAKDYLTSLTWDKQPRLDEWLSKTYGVPNDQYHKAVASNWMKGLVKRIMEPGCKFDYVLVLEGEQGAKKSTSLAVLGRDWHVESAMSTESKDFFMQFQGKAIVEFSEGETLSRTEVKRMKAIITMQSDKYRPPYERTSQDFPRRCVFAMTTNQTEYLKDETGNRRWLPVAVVFAEADVEWLEENRDQLFAEAYHRLYTDNETTYDFPKEETLRQQALRRISDPNEDVIVEWYMTTVSNQDQRDGITIHRVFKQALHSNMPGRAMNKYEEMSIATVLKDVLKLSRVQRMIGGVRVSLWVNRTGQLIKTDDEMSEAARNEDF